MKSDRSEWNHTTDLRERVADAIYNADGEPKAKADAAIKAVSEWFRDNGYLHADGVLGIGKEASR